MTGQVEKTMRKIVLIGVAVTLAFGTAMLVKQRMSGANASVSGGDSSVSRILVATEDMPEGTFIRTEKHFQWMEWPASRLHNNYVLEGTIKSEEYEGAVVRRPMLAGEPIVLSGLVKPDDRSFMAAVLTPGTRAVSIAVNAISGNAGFVFPGDHVDLILTHRVDMVNTNQAMVSETFVDDVRVLAVDQRFNSQNKEIALARTVTLEVTPRQAEMINVATELGKISLSLRSLGHQEGQVAGDDSRMTRDSDVSQLLRYDRYKRATSSVTVSQGGQVQQIQLNQP